MSHAPELRNRQTVALKSGHTLTFGWALSPNRSHCETETNSVAGSWRHQNASELLSARVWELEHQNQQARQANLELNQQCRRHMEHRKELVELLDRDHRRTALQTSSRFQLV